MKTLSEIATELLRAGFNVSHADDHNLLFVTLKRRRVTVQEVLDALGWNLATIPFNVGMAQLGNGVAIVDDCGA